MKNLISDPAKRRTDEAAVFRLRQLFARQSFAIRAGLSAGLSKILGIYLKILRLRSDHRRKTALDDLRRQSAKSGFALDDLTDSQLEAKVTRGTGNIEKLTPFTGKTLYWALRRISPSARELRMRRLKQV